MNRRWFGLVMLTLTVDLAACSQSPQAGDDPQLTPEYGGAESEAGSSLLVNSQLGAVFVLTSGNNEDYWLAEESLRRYTRTGTLQWDKLLNPTDNWLHVNGFSADPSGNLVLSGSTAWVESPHIYRYNAVFNPAGNKIGGFHASIPFEESDPNYESYGTNTVDRNGNIFVIVDSGFDYSQHYLAKLAADGQQLWLLRLPYYARALATDAAGNVYALAQEGQVRKYSPAGTELWRVETPATRFAVAGNSLYLAGAKTYGTGPTAETDGLLTKLDLNGRRLWERSFGTRQRDSATAVAVSASGQIYVTGSTLGSFGATNKGMEDVFVRKYAASGQVSWTKQVGSAQKEEPYDIALMSDSEIYLTGTTAGDLGAGNQGQDDAFLMRLNGLGNIVWVR